MKQDVKKLFQQLKERHENLASSAPVRKNETEAQKAARIRDLEQNPEKWFKYYFPKYAKAEPAPFHKAAAKRVLNNPEWYEVRSWSRELAKSTRTMMEVFYLTLVGNIVPQQLSERHATELPRLRKRNVLLISNSLDNAERLLLPYLVNFDKNARIINDYGNQRLLGNWTSSEFVTAKGVAFRAIGADQSPRGSRNEDHRPDIVIFDDLDTDQDCLNPEIIKKRWDWVEQAVIPTRSISGKLLVMWCGNIISEDCCVVRAQKFADHVDIINVRDAAGKSTWPQKNSEDDIDRVLSKISYASQQKEYFNNPMSVGRAFPSVTWGKCPPLKELSAVVIYADPGTSNKDKPGQKSGEQSSRKAIFLMGKKDRKYYIYRGFLDIMNQDNFIRSLYNLHQSVRGQTAIYTVVECNTLQEPFHDEVIVRKSYEYATAQRIAALSIQKDSRKKGDKWNRIEAELEPINRDGNLIFNEEEKDNPHMERLAAQFMAAHPNAKQLDGPDCIEGGKYKLDGIVNVAKDIATFRRPLNPKRI